MGDGLVEERREGFRVAVAEREPVSHAERKPLDALAMLDTDAQSSPLGYEGALLAVRAAAASGATALARLVFVACKVVLIAGCYALTRVAGGRL